MLAKFESLFKSLFFFLAQLFFIWILRPRKQPAEALHSVVQVFFLPSYLPGKR